MQEKDDNKKIGGKQEPPASFFVFVVLIIPLIAFGVGGYIIYKYYSLTSSGSYAQATIVSYDKVLKNGGGSIYYPVFEFRDEQGKVQEVDSSFGKKVKTFQTGAQIGVYYDVNNPDDFVVDDFWYSAGHGLNFCGIGFFIMLVMGGIVFFVKCDGKAKKCDESA